MKITVVVSRFNSDVTNLAKEMIIKRWLELDLDINNLRVIEVPGAVEIPLIAKKVARTRLSYGIITIGCVIKGETDHYDYVCQQASYGCQKVAIEEEIPVIFGVLTCYNKDQAMVRAKQAGEYVDNVIEMIDKII